LDASTTTEVAVAAEFEADFGSKSHCRTPSLATLLTLVGDLFDEADFSEQHPLRPDEVALDQPPAQSNGSPDRAHANHNGHNSRIPGHLETPSKPQRTGPLGPPERSVPLPQPVDRVRPNMPPGNHVSTPISKPPQPYQRPPAPADTAKPTPGRPVHPSANQPPSNTTNQAVAKPEVRSPTKPPSPLGSQLLEEGCPEELAGKFLSLRALIDKPAASIKSVPAFNPRAESPSIRKTAGFDHSTSAPVTRNTYQILPPQSRSVSPSHIVPPPSSQVGLPAIAASDVARRNVNNQGFASPMTRSPMTTSYRPPTRRSLAASNTNTNANPANPASAAPGMQNVNGKRPPLSDMTNVTSASGDDKGYVPDASKRPKIGDGEGNGPRAPVAGRQGQQAFRTSGPSS
jgi:DNA repair and recombination protein RAD52